MADRVSIVLEDLNIPQLRELITMLGDSVTLERKLAPKGYIFVKMTKAVYEALIPTEIPGNHTRNFSQYWPPNGTVPNQKYPNVRYVAIGRDRTTYRSKFREDVELSGGTPSLPPWIIWKWIDYFGVDNVMAFIPLAEETIEEI